MELSIERRKRRSSDPIIALHYQLSSIRSEVGLDALVLVDDAGCLVAGAGAWPVCEELAAYAPMLAHKDAVVGQAVAEPVEPNDCQTHVQQLDLDGVQALLCARGRCASQALPAMQRAAVGCQRILGMGPC